MYIIYIKLFKRVRKRGRNRAHVLRISFKTNLTKPDRSLQDFNKYII